jgi:hypothetical protein
MGRGETVKRIPVIIALFLAVPLIAQQPNVTAPIPGCYIQDSTGKCVETIAQRDNHTATSLPKPTVPAKPPAITDAQRAQFFKAQSQMIQANAQVQQRQTEFQNAVAEMQKTCGDAYTLQINPNGDPECVAKPAPAKTPEPAKGTK